MKPLLLLSLCFSLVGFAQSAKFTELKMKPSPARYNVDSITIRYPIVILKNIKTEMKINETIKKALLSDYNDTLGSTITLLKQYANEYLTQLSFTIHFNKKDFCP